MCDRTAPALGLVAAPSRRWPSPLPATAAARRPRQRRRTTTLLRVLLFYKPNFHASHVQARQAVRDLADRARRPQYGQTVEIQETDDPAAFTTANLATVDAVVFAQTGGVLFNAAQRAALEAYIRGGGGYMGMHYAGWSVGQSEHDVNPFYARLVGAVSEGHPENPGVRPGRVVVKDAGHPLTQGVPASFTRSDEWYDWTSTRRPTCAPCSRPTSPPTAAAGRAPRTRSPGARRSTAVGPGTPAMGHEGTAYSEPFMRTQMRNGLAYAAGLLAGRLLAARPRTRPARWSGVTPWPLMPINMALTSDGKVQSFGSVGGWGNDTTPYDWTGNSSITQGGQMEVDVWDPAQAAHPGEPPQRHPAEHHLHRPVLLDAGAEPARPLDDDGRR